MRLSRHVAATLDQSSVLNQGERPRTGYVVFAGNYVSNSAGIECLHRLCHELNRRGYPSFTAGGDIPAPHLNAPMVDAATASELAARGFTAIYPETIHGNPFNAKNVIRWVLNRPGLLGGDSTYADSEQVYTYSSVYSPYIENRIAGKLYMPVIDDRLFYCREADLSKRSLECYYVGKSQWQRGVVDPSQAFEITRETPAKADLGKLFRSSRVLYCFDNSSIIIYEALLCGCPVVVIPDGTHAKDDFQQLELGVDGISWGRDECPPAPPSVSRLRARYEAVKRDFDVQLRQLIAASQAEVVASVDWDSLQRDERRPDWSTISQRAVMQSVRHVDRFLRNTERGIRRFRKRCVKQLRHMIVNNAKSISDDAVFYDPNDELTNRSLQCCSLDRRDKHTDAFDTNEVVPIAPGMGAAQVAKLLRASRRYYSFRRNDPLIDCALKCGCPVTLIDRSERRQNLRPPIRNASLASSRALDQATNRPLHSAAAA